MKNRFYHVYGTLVVLLMSYVHLTGWGWADVDELAQVPHSVRSNPGSYRSHYSSHIHYSGGK